jgi:hypothetical protein
VALGPHGGVLPPDNAAIMNAAPQSYDRGKRHGTGVRIVRSHKIQYDEQERCQPLSSRTLCGGEVHCVALGVHGDGLSVGAPDGVALRMR